MSRSRALIVVYGEWESIENMLRDVDALLPGHDVYMVGVIPCLRGRTMLNKLYVDVVMRKLEKEFAKAEEILGSKGIGIAGKDIIKGKPGEALRRYLEKKVYETVFIPLQLPPSKRLLVAVAKPVLEGKTGLILYTPQTRIGDCRDILILAKDKPPYKFHTGYTSLVDIDTVEFAFTHKPSLEEIENYLRKRKYLRYRHLVLSRIQSGKIEEKIEDGLKDYRFCIVHPDIFYKKVFRGYMLTPLARAIILSSLRPIIISS